MAEILPPAKAETILVSQPVQELVIDGDQLPERYICKENDRGIIDASVPLIEIPVIDLSLLTNSSSTGRQELDKLQSALSSWGCFQAVNHGMASSLLDEVREVTKQFFALPVEEKQKYSRAADDIEGYGNDMVLSEHQTLDWTDRVYLLVNPEEQRKLKYWPENPKTFRDILHEYSTKLRLITELLLKAMARSLNLEEESFLKQYGQQAKVYARFNFYPQCPRPDLVLGLKPHADGSAITILLQDKEVEGLQILKDDQWVRVPIVPHALLVNVGDQVEIMSNGIYKSPVHRVLTNSERERISVAMFCSPDPEKEIEPVGELVNDNRPQLYKKVKNYVAAYFQYYQQWKRPIDAVKI
ncbi:hypothetical protein F0562_009381 [Nyssa sinensis]|uniref:Fe2OG dioxygenase domain-containing protein n=1 Tax=Nyssa sinensis TaxID=561372 RepID=A0A5J4ZZ28_9ASTE|nr:hypothetical protein F0562_009381 [Nyssa sinensis]